MSTESRSVSRKLSQLPEKHQKNTRVPERKPETSPENSGVPGGCASRVLLLLSKLRRTLDVGALLLYPLPHLLDNLMNSLARKVKFVRDKTQRFSAAVKFKNLRVSVKIRLRSWSQRAPLPTRDLFKFLRALDAQLSLSMALSKITNPRTKRQRGAVDVLDVRRGNSTMSFARGELVDGCNGEVESCYIVHEKNNNTTSSRRTDVRPRF